MTPPSTKSSSPRSTTHAGLTAQDVVDAALKLVETEGGDALTMRRLASELDVATTTIYWHVGNRDELVVALIARLAERMGASEITGATALERVTCAATNIWDSALAHRNVTAAGESGGSNHAAAPASRSVSPRRARGCRAPRSRGP